MLVGAAQPALAATLSVCGTLQALVRPNPPQNEGGGSATIDGKVYHLTSALSSNRTNTIDPAATVGSRVCLSGEHSGAAEPPLLHNFVLAACPSGSSAPGCTPSSLPSTSTGPVADGLPMLSGGGIVLALALAAAAWVRSRSALGTGADLDAADNHWP